MPETEENLLVYFQNLQYSGIRPCDGNKAVTLVEHRMIILCTNQWLNDILARWYEPKRLPLGISLDDVPDTITRYLLTQLCHYLLTTNGRPMLVAPAVDINGQPILPDPASENSENGKAFGYRRSFWLSLWTGAGPDNVAKYVSVVEALALDLNWWVDGYASKRPHYFNFPRIFLPRR